MRFPDVSGRSRRVVLGCLALAGTLGLLAGFAMLVFVAGGGVDVAADRPHGWLTYQLLHFAFNRSVGLRAGAIDPPADLAARSRVRLSAQHYFLVCSNCHGGPGIGQSPVALSMTPRPQSLPAVVEQFSDAELFWIVKHGVKFSAMPSWTTRTRDDEVWSMVAFLRQLPEMTAASYLEATAAPRSDPDTAPAIPFGQTVTLGDADVSRNTYPQNEHLYAAPAVAFGDRSVLGDALAACSRCHGADGTGSATDGEAPNLTIQDADYLAASLKAYAGGSRASGFMQPVASQLSGSQIAALADYYAGLAPQTAKTGSPDPQTAARGRSIALEGLREQGIPGCATCHESAGSKVVAAPRLSGQSARYLSRQLQAMRDEDRGSTRFWNPMPAVAHALSDDAITAVSAFYTARPPTRQADAEEAGPSPAPAGDRAAGERIFAQVCSHCHTPDARGDAEGDFPDLTIQTAPYAVLALHAYRAGERKNEKMQLVTGKLDGGEIASLAAYIGSLEPQPGRAGVDAGAAARGAAMARNGLGERGVPACLSCHDAAATAALPLIARLQGQNVGYLTNKLDYFAGPLAADLSALNPMPAIASRLTKAEQSDVAAYFATQAPLAKPPLQR